MIKADKIIDKFKDKYGFVIDIDKVLAYLCESNLVLKEKNEVLYAILCHNNSVDIKRRAELESSRRTITSVVTKAKGINESHVVPAPSVETELFDVSQYIEEIDNSDDLELLTDILPTIEERDYDNIIFSLLLHYRKEIIEFCGLLFPTNDSKGNEDILAEITRLKSVFDAIKQYDTDEKSDSPAPVDDTKKCNLFYLRKDSGGYYIDDDVDSLELAVYESKVISDIANGTSKSGEKKFTDNKKLDGVSKYRKRDSRTILVRIDDENVVVLATLNKKTFHNSIAYQDFIGLRRKIYLQQIQSILDRMHDDDFIAENNEITERITKKLSPQKKCLKAGDYNG